MRDTAPDVSSERFVVMYGPRRYTDEENNSRSCLARQLFLVVYRNRCGEQTVGIVP